MIELIGNGSRLRSKLTLNYMYRTINKAMNKIQAAHFDGRVGVYDSSHSLAS